MDEMMGVAAEKGLTISELTGINQPIIDAIGNAGWNTSSYNC